MLTADKDIRNMYEIHLKLKVVIINMVVIHHLEQQSNKPSISPQQLDLVIKAPPENQSYDRQGLQQEDDLVEVDGFELIKAKGGCQSHGLYVHHLAGDQPLRSDGARELGDHTDNASKWDGVIS